VTALGLIAGTFSGDASVQEGGVVKRVFSLAVVVAVAAVALAASSFMSVGSTQEGATEQAHICAPWSKAWDISEGHWYFVWYRWCYDPAISDPSVEENWSIEEANWEWSEQANMCPESGTCTVSPGKTIMNMGTP
jgi:hypothetical protein